MRYCYFNFPRGKGGNIFEKWYLLQSILRNFSVSSVASYWFTGWTLVSCWSILQPTLFSESRQPCCKLHSNTYFQKGHSTPILFACSWKLIRVLVKTPLAALRDALSSFRIYSESDIRGFFNIIVFEQGGSPTPHPFSSRPPFVCKFSCQRSTEVF